MANDNLRGWIEILSNVGVLIGIVFLVYEINQNNIGQRMEAKLALSERFAELDGSVAENAELARLLVKADVEGAELSPVEFLQYQAHNNRWLSILMRVEALHEDGVFNDVDWRHYVCEVRRFYVGSEAFRQFVEIAKQEYLVQPLYEALTKPAVCGA